MPDPKYRVIADDLRRMIESGELAGGEQLPTEIELMEQYEASRNTIRDAIKLLSSRREVEARPGQGTFVVERINPIVTTLTEDPETGRGGGEEGVYIAEVEAANRMPENSDPRVEIQKVRGNLAAANAALGASALPRPSACWTLHRAHDTCSREGRVLHSWFHLRLPAQDRRVDQLFGG